MSGITFEEKMGVRGSVLFAGHCCGIDTLAVSLLLLLAMFCS